MYKPRKATIFLEEWLGRDNRKPLIIRGARQVGKSTLVKEFGKQFDYFISLNLERRDDAVLFQEVVNIKQVRDELFLRHGIPLSAKGCLIFIDEIQEAPIAIQQLRYFYEDLPEVAVIAAGSLLEFATADVPSFPVGRVSFYQLHPLDFDEFLTWIGRGNLLEFLDTVPLPVAAMRPLFEWYNTYAMIGGMPEVVATYARTKSLASLSTIYEEQWLTYQQDAEKYARSPQQRAILRHLVATAPLATDRIKFAGFGNSDYGSREVGEGFRTLDMAKLIRLIYPTTVTEPPAVNNLRKRPRLQFLDTGLLNFALKIQADLIGLKDLNNYHRGHIVQHHITQELIAVNHSPAFVPNFWVRENANANAEVDLVYEYNGKLVPIEVKSGAKGRLRSLHEYMDRCPHHLAVRFLKNNFSIESAVTSKGKSFKLLNLPYFLFSRIDRYLALLEQA